MASRTSTPQSRSRSASGSSSSSDTTMIDAPPQTPRVRLRNPSQSISSLNEPTITLHTASPDPSFSLLLSLPRELRDRVYSFALTSRHVFSWPGKSPPDYRHNVGIGLLLANRQIFDEAVPLLYSSNKFLFTHPSDCNIFRVVASPASQYISSVYFRIREKDLRLWTSYLGSNTEDRSLRADLPRLKNLWILMRCGHMRNLGQLGGPAVHGLFPPGVQMQVQAVQNALGQQVQALQQQLQSLTQAMAAQHPTNNAHLPPPPPPPPLLPHQQQGQTPIQQVVNITVPPPVVAQGDTNDDNNNNLNPPPPASVMSFIQFAQPPILPTPHDPNIPHDDNNDNNLNPNNPQPPPHIAAPPSIHTPHAHPLYTSLLRFEREMGLESLCLSLRDTLETANTDVKIVCIMRAPRGEVVRLVGLYPEELSVEGTWGGGSARNAEGGGRWDGVGSARTRFRRLHGVDVGVELSGYDVGMRYE